MTVHAVVYTTFQELLDLSPFPLGPHCSKAQEVWGEFLVRKRNKMAGYPGAGYGGQPPQYGAPGGYGAQQYGTVPQGEIQHCLALLIRSPLCFCFMLYIQVFNNAADPVQFQIILILAHAKYSNCFAE